MSKSLKHLMLAYTGETQARFRYKLYAEVAIDEGYQQIANNFYKTADQETEHAEIFWNLILKYGGTSISLHNANYPIAIGTTLENLQFAYNGEHEEWTNLYKNWGDEATEIDVKNAFLNIATIEHTHANRFEKFIENIKNNKVFEKDNIVKWQCSNCGFIHEGLTALDPCPVCGFSKSYAEVYTQNF